MEEIVTKQAIGTSKAQEIIKVDIAEHGVAWIIPHAIISLASVSSFKAKEVPNFFI